MPTIILGLEGRKYLSQALRNHTGEAMQRFGHALSILQPAEEWSLTAEEASALEQVLVTRLEETPQASRMDHLTNRHLQRCLRHARDSNEPINCHEDSLKEHILALTAAGHVTEEMAGEIRVLLEQLSEELFPHLSYTEPTHARNMAHARLAIANEALRTLIPLLCKQFEQEVSGIFAEIVMIES